MLPTFPFSFYNVGLRSLEQWKYQTEMPPLMAQVVKQMVFALPFEQP